MTLANPTGDGFARPEEIPCKGSTVNDAGNAPERKVYGVLIPHGSTMVEAERILVLSAIERHLGNKTHAAESLGISLKTLYNILNRNLRGREKART